MGSSKEIKKRVAELLRGVSSNRFSPDLINGAINSYSAIHDKEKKELNPESPRGQAEINAVQGLENYLNNQEKRDSLPTMLGNADVKKELSTIKGAPDDEAAYKLLEKARKITVEYNVALRLADRNPRKYKEEMASLKGRTKSVGEQARSMYETLKALAGDNKDPDDLISRGVSYLRNLAEKLEGLSGMLKDLDISPGGRRGSLPR